MPMRKVLLIVGVLALAIGLLWIGQGTGVINWPQSSFMIQAGPMGRLRRGAGRFRPGPDLAEPALEFTLGHQP
jgi:hypothetical protein